MDGGPEFHQEHVHGSQGWRNGTGRRRDDRLEPEAARIVSWHFDPQGGYGSDVWVKDGNKWVITATATSHEGSDATAVNSITKNDANSFTWQSSNQTLDGVHLPECGPGENGPSRKSEVTV